MRQIPIEAMEQVQRELPEIVDAIQARSKGAVILVLDDFEGEPDLFFNTVWYAASHGRRVVIEPTH